MGFCSECTCLRFFEVLEVEGADFCRCFEEFKDFSELTSSSISLQLRRLELEPGALVAAGVEVTAAGGVCPSLLMCSLSFADRRIMFVQG